MDSTKADGSNVGALFVAAQEGHVSCVRFLLEQKALVNYHTTRGSTPLRQVCAIGERQETHCQIAIMLIEAKADVSDKQLLHYSIRNEDLKLTRILLAAGAATFDNILHEACQNLPIVTCLVEGKWSVNTLCGKGGASPLFVAASKGSIAIVDYLLHQRASPSLEALVKHTDGVERKMNPMQIAAANNHVDTAMRLCITEDDRNTIVETALYNSAWNVLERFLPLVDTASEAIVKNQTILCWAVRLNNVAMVRFLLKHGVSADVGAKKLDALCSAAMLNNVELGKMLVRHLDINKPCSHVGFTPLIVACEAGACAFVKWLIDAKANLYARTAQDLSACSYAIFNHHLAVLELLVENGFEPPFLDVAETIADKHFDAWRLLVPIFFALHPYQVRDSSKTLQVRRLICTAMKRDAQLCFRFLITFLQSHIPWLLTQCILDALTAGNLKALRFLLVAGIRDEECPTLDNLQEAVLLDSFGGAVSKILQQHNMFSVSCLIVDFLMCWTDVAPLLFVKKSSK